MLSVTPEGLRRSEALTLVVTHRVRPRSFKWSNSGPFGVASRARSIPPLRKWYTATERPSTIRSSSKPATCVVTLPTGRTNAPSKDSNSSNISREAAGDSVAEGAHEGQPYSDLAVPSRRPRGVPPALDFSAKIPGKNSVYLSVDSCDKEERDQFSIEHNKPSGRELCTSEIIRPRGQEGILYATGQTCPRGQLLRAEGHRDGPRGQFYQDESPGHVYCSEESNLTDSKIISAKGGLKDRLEFWLSFTKNPFVLDMMKNGFNVSFIQPPPPANFQNIASALRDKEFVEESINEMLEGGYAVELLEPPQGYKPPFGFSPIKWQKTPYPRFNLRYVNKHT